MSRFCTLCSSSKGNCYYISGGGASLLVDAGIGPRTLKNALDSLDVRLEELQGIVITHEHTDHIKGLCSLTRKLKLPVYASAGTLSALEAMGAVPPEAVLIELAGEQELGGIGIRSFPTPHDAVDPVGLRFSMPDGRTVGIATDLGHVNDVIRTALTGCDLVLLESNYDPAMLRAGSYPWPLKRRVEGEKGHLSNEAGALLATYLVQRGTTRFVLGHLSQNNNLPDLAYLTAKEALEESGAREGIDFLLSVAPAQTAHPIIVF